jgi:hypothetical protein
LVFPIVTVLASGFLGYGIGVVMLILTFVGTFYRPRWLLVVASIAAVYFGLSLFIAYAQSRQAIRDSVWGGESLEKRIDVGLDMLTRFEFFDLGDPRHLDWIDWRLNQNELLGAAKEYTPRAAPFLYGQTIADAAIAAIPRAIWPDKPALAGSSDYVTQHTGILFAEGTSVGMGQVFEFYINFGTPGVIVGFLLLGMVMRHMDDRLIGGISRENWSSVAFWFIVGSSALQVGGSLAEIAASMMAAVVLTLASGAILKKRKFGSRQTRGSLAGRGTGALRRDNLPRPER